MRSSADLTITEKIAAAVASRPEVLEAYLFGSVARGEEQPHSDVDVAVFVEPDACHKPGFGIGAEMGAELQAALKRSDVDVVVLNDAAPLLYHRVLRDGVRVYSRDLVATTRREGYALSRYCDYVPQLHKIEVAHRARIAAGNLGK
jgi:predicted nucleotidyltransferase